MTRPTFTTRGSLTDDGISRFGLFLARPFHRLWGPRVIATAVVILAPILTSCGTGNKPGKSPAASAPTPGVRSAETAPGSPTITPTMSPTMSPTSASPLPPTPPTTSASITLSECTTAQLHIALASSGSAVAHRGLLFTLTNTSSSRCELIGYPGFELVAGSQILTADPQRGSGYIYQDPGPHRVVLNSGAAASFGVTTAEISPTQSQCPEADAALVTPPDETHTARVAVTTPGCAHTSPAVTAIVAGPGGPPA